METIQFIREIVRWLNLVNLLFVDRRCLFLFTVGGTGVDVYIVLFIDRLKICILLNLNCLQFEKIDS